LRDIEFPVNDPIVQLFGKLYETCRLSNWDYHGTAEEKRRQREIVDWCGQFNLEMAAHVQLGRNVIFVGPSGTGKDRLAVSLSRCALANQFTVSRYTGAEMWALTRDVINGHESEAELLRRFCEPDVLVISDPLLPGQPLSDWQVSWFYRITNSRGDKCKSIWCTLNVAGKEEAEQRLSPQCWGRLNRDAKVVKCFWSSYRKPAEVVG